MSSAVTLKKAAELSRAVIALSKALPIPTTFALSSFSTANVEDSLTEAREAFSAAASRSLVLFDLGYKLRARVGVANASAGIDSMLAEVALIDEKITRLSALSKDTSEVYGAVEIGSDDVSALKRRVETARRDATSDEATARSFGGSRGETLTINVVTKEIKASISNDIATLKRSRVNLKDKITGLNFTNTIVLEDDMVAILTEEKLI